MRDYNPNAMFPKKPTHGVTGLGLKATIKRWLTIVGLSALAVSCQNVRTIDVGFGGLDIEYYEPPPITIYTNIIRTNFISHPYPRLMEQKQIRKTLWETYTEYVGWSH